MPYRTLGLLVALALGLIVAPLRADTQPPAKAPRLGYLGETPGPDAEAFRQGLRELGYVEGQNIAVEYRWAEGKDERLPDLAAELVRLLVDVIVTPGTQTSLAVKHATTTIPIVMAHVGDPIGAGLITSLARPGGNITGVSVIARESEGKRLELLKQAVPQASRVAVLWRATHLFAPTLSELQVAASALGVTLQHAAVRGAEDFERAFATITTAHVDALFVSQDHLFTSYRARIVDFAAQSRLPAVYMYREWADAGGLMAYGPDLRDVYRRVATLMDKLLRGAKPSELPVEQSMRFALVINLKAAQALGLIIPPTLLFQADEVIR